MLEFIITENIKELEKVKLPDPGLLNYYNRFENRELFINYDIDDDLVECAYDVIRWNREDVDIPIDKRKPIKIFINSNGGCLNSVQVLIDTLKLSKTHVITIGMGKVLSAGFLLLLAGHKRYCFENTEGLLHSGSFGVANSVEKVYDYIEHNKKIEGKVKKYITENTNISVEEYEKNYRNEWYMTAEDMLDLKIVHKIIDDLDEII